MRKRDIKAEAHRRDLLDLAWLEKMIEEIGQEMKNTDMESVKKRLSYALGHYSAERNKLRNKLVANDWD